jgi:hypothetical protein
MMINVDVREWAENCTRCGTRVKLSAIKLRQNGNVTLEVRCPACEAEQSIELMRVGSHETLGPRR